MSTLSDDLLPKLARLVRLLGSDVDGEALGACRALSRTLKGADRDLHWLAARIEEGPEPPEAAEPDDELTKWDPYRRTDIAYVLEYCASLGCLTQWEADFVKSVAPRIRSWGHLSERQISIVERLLAKIGRAAG